MGVKCWAAINTNFLVAYCAARQTSRCTRLAHLRKTCRCCCGVVLVVNNKTTRTTRKSTSVIFENVHFPRYFTAVANCGHRIYCRFVFSALPGNQRPGLNDGNQAGPTLRSADNLWTKKMNMNKTNFVCHINYILTFYLLRVADIIS